MSKHTPGPWQLAEKYNCKDVRAVDGPYVADCNASAAIDWRTKEANARLIAAAPEMLEALNAAVEAIEHGGLDDVMCCNGWDCGCRASTNGDLLVHDLRAVIAKATGEA